MCTHPKQVCATQFISVILNSNRFEFVRLVLNNSVCQAKRIDFATCVSLFQASHGHKVAERIFKIIRNSNEYVVYRHFPLLGSVKTRMAMIVTYLLPFFFFLKTITLSSKLD